MKESFIYVPKAFVLSLQILLQIYIITNIYIKCLALRENLIYILVVMIEWRVIFII